MKLSFNINNTGGLQLFQLLRFICFLVISVVLAKAHFSDSDIGDWETFVFVSGALSFFWVTGIIQSLLSLYDHNVVFARHTSDSGKSPELFNTFLLLVMFSVLLMLLIWFSTSINLFGAAKNVPYLGPLLLYFFLSNTTPLIEYIYLLKNKPGHIYIYGIVSFTLQTLFVCLPLIFGLDLVWAIWGLILLTGLRFLLLLQLLWKYAEFKFSWAYVKNHLYVGYPLIISTLLSGSSQYIDGVIAYFAFTPERFAIFRYGCKELPFVVMMTSALNNVMIPAFGNRKNIPAALAEIRRASLRLMHILYPLSILFMLFSKVIFGQILFNDTFYRSADVFMVYQLLIISRIVFPQTILMGLKKNRVILWAAILEFFLHIGWSIFFTHFYSVTGLPLGSGLVHIVEKLVLIWYVYRHLHIHPDSYIPVKWYLFYSLLISAVFILIDHRVIYII